MPSCTSFNGTAITVVWEPPTELGGRSDTYYTIEYESLASPDNMIEIDPVSGTTYTITALEPITEYRVRVFAENGVSDQDMRPGIRSTRMSETICGTGEGGMF